jgi:hypothetical protein
MSRFDRLPVIDDKNTTRRNYVVGGMYLLAGCVAVGAIGSDSDDDPEGTDQTSDNGDTTTPESTITVQDTTAPDDSPEDGDTTTPESTTTVQDTTATPTDAQEGPPTAGALSAVSQNPAWLDNRESLSGNGQTVTDTFQASRFTTFVFEHNGDSNFIVELINDSTGDSEDILINEIGQVSGAVGTGLPDGDYLLDIDANGEWTIELGEPFAPEGEWGVPPASIEGESKDVYGELEIDDRVTFSAQHDGDSNFVVEVYDEMNTGPFADEIVFNEIGQFDGETSVQLSGLFYIVVNANGSYTIDIS